MPTTPPPTSVVADAPVVAAASESDVQRQKGTEAFTQALTALAQRADALDKAWDRLKLSCGIGALPGGESHQWFQVYDSRSPARAALANCLSPLDTVQQEAGAIAGAMLAADEAARRADVFPGTLRELRRRFRLDYVSWDR